MLMFSINWGQVRARDANGMRSLTARIQERGSMVIQGAEDATDFPHQFRTILRQAITTARQRLNLVDTTLVGALINARDGAGTAYAIGIQPIPFRDFDVNYILDQIIQKLESSQTIDMTMDIRF